MIMKILINTINPSFRLGDKQFVCNNPKPIQNGKLKMIKARLMDMKSDQIYLLHVKCILNSTFCEQKT